jgi:hypothetical protein
MKQIDGFRLGMAMILDCDPLSRSSPHRNGIFQGALQLSTDRIGEVVFIDGAAR